MAERLDVVDDGRALVEAEHRGKYGRLDARVGALALERFDQAGLLAADVGAGAAVDEDFAGCNPSPECSGPQEVRGPRLGDGLFQNARAVGHLAADVDVGLLHVVREARDHHALDQLVRVLVDDVAVLEGARLGLVGVDDEVNRLAAAAVDQRPLQSAAKARAAAAAQAGALDLVDDGLGLHRHGLFQGLVAAMLQEARQVVRVPRLVDVLENDPALFGSSHDVSVSSPPP
jgi:hypothetical protein